MTHVLMLGYYSFLEFSSKWKVSKMLKGFRGCYQATPKHKKFEIFMWNPRWLKTKHWNTNFLMRATIAPSFVEIKATFFFKGYVWRRYGARWPCPSPFTEELWIFHQVWGLCRFLWVFMYAKALKNTISIQKNNKNLCKKQKVPYNLGAWALIMFL